MDYIEDLKKLAGIENEVTSSNTQMYDTRSILEKKQIEYDNNIKPGTSEWFDLWFTFPNPTNMSPGFRGRRK